MAMTWHGKEATILLAQEMHKRVKMASLLVQRVTQHLLKRGGRTESGFGKAKARVGSYHSKPGEPPRTQTGRLRRSIRAEVEPKVPSVAGLLKGFEGRVGTNIVYGRELEMGRPARTIKVKTKKVLAARVGTQGWVYFGKEVRLPPMAPRPYLRPAYHRSLRAIQAIFRRPMNML